MFVQWIRMSIDFIFVTFQETKRPSKEMQVTIARQLGLEPTTVGNFFMNARRRSMDKWKDDDAPSQDEHQQMSPLDDNGMMLHDDGSELDADDPDQHGDLDGDHSDGLLWHQAAGQLGQSPQLSQFAQPVDRHLLVLWLR